MKTILIAVAVLMASLAVGQEAKKDPSLKETTEWMANFVIAHSAYHAADGGVSTTTLAFDGCKVTQRFISLDKNGVVKEAPKDAPFAYFTFSLADLVRSPDH